MPFEVHTPVFDGPFDLLLHLILREQVDLYDINLSEIVDAYLVAAAARRGDAPLSWDVNGDGRVNAADAKQLAQRAVRLPR